jgi:outer membrane protein assembly factor BamB
MIINNTGQSPFNGSATNTTRWIFSAGRTVVSSPVIGSDGSIYFGSTGGDVYAVNTNGTLIWKYSIYHAISSTPAIDSDGSIYVANGNLYSLNPSNGKLNWICNGLNVDKSSPSIDNRYHLHWK